MIALKEVCKYYGAHLVLDHVDWRLFPGEHVALCGSNGAGKSTLLKLVVGLAEADSGTVELARNISIGYLTQDLPELGDRQLIDLLWDGQAEVRALFGRLDAINNAIEAAGAAGASVDAASADESPDLLDLVGEQSHIHEEIERKDGYRAAALIGKVAKGLGFSQFDLERSLASFSGGWRMRAALARMLVSEPDVLLLDEPTNHLDIEAIEWLEGYLDASRFAWVVISHDRRFLDRVVRRVSILERGSVSDWTGNYSDYEQQRAARDAEMLSAADRQERELERAQAFIDRFRAKATKARAVKSRAKAIAKLERIDRPQAEKTVSFQFSAAPGSARLVARANALKKAYGGKPVLAGIELELERGMRLALIGPNGCGKSTLLRILASREPPDSCAIQYGPGLHLGYFAQDFADRLDLEATVIDTAYQAAPDRWSLLEVRSLLAGFLLRGPTVERKVGQLSGGQRARLALAMLLLEPHNLLLLDEPTNHLDLGSKAVLAEALANFGGTIVLACHDRHVVDLVATHVMALPVGRVFEGNYSDNAERLAALGHAPASIAAPAVLPIDPGRHQIAVPPANAGIPVAPQVRSPSRNRGTSVRPGRRELERLSTLEQKVAELEARKVELEALWSDQESYGESAGLDLAAVHREYQAVAAELELTFAQWLGLAQELE